jgi:Tol biopolymer transport system component
VRDLSPDLSYFQQPRWAPDGSITVQGSDLKGRQGIFRVDSKTGTTSPIVLSDPPGSVGQAAWTPDGQSLVFRRDGQKARVVVRDIATGAERTLVEQALAGLSLSPDGQTIAYLVYDRASNTTSINTMSISAGAPTVIGKVTARPRNMSAWTPDGRAIVFAANDNERTALWTIAAGGGTPQKLDLEGYNSGPHVRVHPDGRHIVYETGRLAHEIWTLENFLPSAPAKSTRR